MVRKLKAKERKRKMDAVYEYNLKKKTKEQMEASNDIITIVDSSDKTRARQEKEKCEKEMKRLLKVLGDAFSSFGVSRGNTSGWTQPLGDIYGSNGHGGPKKLRSSRGGARVTQSMGDVNREIGSTRGGACMLGPLDNARHALGMPGGRCRLGTICDDLGSHNDEISQGAHSNGGMLKEATRD
ncbi:unnamed protein product [Ilex paraguariensis]